VERALKATDPADKHAALEQVGIATKRLVNLSNQLLTLASVDQESPGNIRFEKINLVELVREVGFRWVDVALEKDIDIEFIEGEAVVEVTANPLLLEELVSNLIDNAIRYSPKGTRTAITVLPGPGPQILVEDEGQGIPADSREKVFERFYRLSEAGTEGSGLGLAIVRDIARLHQAEVTIESRESGLGTRVRVSFPPKTT
jgi:two-component system sensor histidine kinase TctE